MLQAKLTLNKKCLFGSGFAVRSIDTGVGYGRLLVGLALGHAQNPTLLSDAATISPLMQLELQPRTSHDHAEHVVAATPRQLSHSARPGGKQIKFARYQLHQSSHLRQQSPRQMPKIGDSSMFHLCIAAVALVETHVMVSTTRKERYVAPSIAF